LATRDCRSQAALPRSSATWAESVVGLARAEKKRGRGELALLLVLGHAWAAVGCELGRVRPGEKERRWWAEEKFLFFLFMKNVKSTILCKFISK
jgi:hypothetical protein